MTTPRISSVEPAPANAPQGQAQARRPVPLGMVSSRAVRPMTLVGMHDRGPGNAAPVEEPADAAPRVAKGIAFGLLLAIPFWVALAAWLLG